MRLPVRCCACGLVSPRPLLILSVSQGSGDFSGRTTPWAILIKVFLYSVVLMGIWKSNVRQFSKERTLTAAPNLKESGWTGPGEHILLPWELMEKYCAVPPLPWLQDQPLEST